MPTQRFFQPQVIRLVTFLMTEKTFDVEKFVGSKFLMKENLAMVTEPIKKKSKSAVFSATSMNGPFSRMS